MQLIVNQEKYEDMENLLSIKEYTEKIEEDLKKLENGAQYDQLAEVFATADTSQTGTIDKSDLAMVLEKGGMSMIINFREFVKCQKYL